MGTDVRQSCPEQYRALFEVSEAIALHRDLDALCRDLARRLPHIVPFDFINIVLHDSSRDVMRLCFLVTPQPTTIHPGFELPPDESPGGLVWKTQQPLTVNDIAQERRFPKLTPLLIENGVQSYCVVPLTTAQRRLGGMGFGSLQKRVYQDAELAFMQQVARQVAVAVDNTLNYESARAAQEQLARERDRQRLLLEVSESIASHRDLKALLQDLAGRFPSVVPFEYIGLVLHDPERKVMRAYYVGTSDNESLPPGIEVPVEESAGGWVLTTQRPLIVPRLEDEPRFPKVAEILKKIGAQSYFMFPLTTAVRRLGAMFIARKRPSELDQADRDFLQQVVNQVAVTVDNVLNYDRVQVAQRQLALERDRLRLLLEVNNAVVAHLDLDALFTAVSACLRTVIQQDGSSLVLVNQETRRYRVHVLDFTTETSFIEEGETGPECQHGPSGLAINTRKPVVVTERELTEMAAASKMCVNLLGRGVKTLCSLPLLAHDRPLGALNVGSCRHEAFSPEDVELLSEVSKQISIAVENALAYRQIAELKDKLNSEKLYLEREIQNEHNFEEIIGDGPALKRILRQVETVAPTDSTVLIQGETGTGKELIARAIHSLSGRRERTFVRMNCAAIPTGLLESELFGHERGAFTGAIAQKIGRFELAHQGTLFLDEVGDIPLELQSKLLRVLQEQEFERLGSTKTIKVNVRLVAATNRDLARMVADKQFRSDLYYRFNVFPVTMPPLRERTEDIPLLIRYFAQKYAQRMKKRIESIPADTMTALSAYHWPGNIRELENLIERSVILSQGSDLLVPLAELKAQVPAASDGDGAATLEAAERQHILRALDETGWVIGGPSGAAVRLGMKRTTLQSKMYKLGITKQT
jgi:formate hydrogenlyase transcriptional activator